MFIDNLCMAERIFMLDHITVSRKNIITVKINLQYRGTMASSTTEGESMLSLLFTLNNAQLQDEFKPHSNKHIINFVSFAGARSTCPTVHKALHSGVYQHSKVYFNDYYVLHGISCGYLHSKLYSVPCGQLMKLGDVIRSFF